MLKHATQTFAIASARVTTQQPHKQNRQQVTFTGQWGIDTLSRHGFSVSVTLCRVRLLRVLLCTVHYTHTHTHTQNKDRINKQPHDRTGSVRLYFN